MFEHLLQIIQLTQSKYRCHHCVVSLDCCVVLQWPRLIASLHTSMGRPRLSSRTWSSYHLFGRLGWRFLDFSGCQPKDKSIRQCRAAVLGSIPVIWPIMELRPLTMYSITGGRPVWLHNILNPKVSLITHQLEGHQVAESAVQSAFPSPHTQQYGTQPGPAKPPVTCEYQLRLITTLLSTQSMFLSSINSTTVG